MHCWFVCFVFYYGVYGYFLSLSDHASPHEPEDLFLATFKCKQDIHPQEDSSTLDVDKSLKQIDSQ